jgi:ABC-type dipeptide/oligopeptide/nickel transport systems, permease components
MNSARHVLPPDLWRPAVAVHGRDAGACALLIGGTLGITAGFSGGWVNMMIMRIMDVFYAFPSVLLAISLSGAMGAGRRIR